MNGKEDQNIEGLAQAKVKLIRNAALGIETILATKDEVRATVIKALVTGVSFSKKYEAWKTHQSGSQ